MGKTAIRPYNAAPPDQTSANTPRYALGDAVRILSIDASGFRRVQGGMSGHVVEICMANLYIVQMDDQSRKGYFGQELERIA